MKRYLAAALVLAGGVVQLASADIVRTLNFNDPSGLKAKATFTLDLSQPSVLKISLTNLSTALPVGFSNSDMLLTSLSFDLPGAGAIASGGAAIAAGSQSINFDNVVSQLGGGANVSAEWGFGNGGTTGLQANYVSGNQAGTTKFGAGNLDGPNGLNGPQGGLVADPFIGNLGGLGAIRNSIDFVLTLSSPLANLNFLDLGAIVEYGSDAAFVPNTFVPAPGAALLALLGLGGALGASRKAIQG